MPGTALRESAFLVLTALAGQPQHGYTLIEDIERLSEGRVRLRTGTVYALLERLRDAGLIEIHSEEVVASRLRRYYRLSDVGAAALSAESDTLRRRANAADGLLRQTRSSAPASAPPPDSAAALGPAAAPPEQLIHPAFFYRGAEEYLAATIPFITAGLEAGEAVAVAVPTGNLELIRAGLQQLASQVHMLDLTGIGRNPGRIIPTVLLAFAQDHPDRRIRIIGEPMWPSRSAAEYPACVRHEALINLVFAGQPATIMCPYDSSQLDPQVLADAARTHPILSDEAGSRASDRYAPYEVLDAYNLALPGDDITQALVLDFDALSQARVRAAAVAHAQSLGLPASRCSDLEIVIGELASNSVRHGGGSGTVTVGRGDGPILCQIQDRGTLSDVLAGCRLIPADQPSGRGLLTVNRAADLVRTYAVEGCTVTRAYFRSGTQ